MCVYIYIYTYIYLSIYLSIYIYIFIVYIQTLLHAYTSTLPCICTLLAHTPRSLYSHVDSTPTPWRCTTSSRSGARTAPRTLPSRSRPARPRFEGSWEGTREGDSAARASVRSVTTKQREDWEQHRQTSITIHTNNKAARPPSRSSRRPSSRSLPRSPPWRRRSTSSPAI